MSGAGVRQSIEASRAWWQPGSRGGEGSQHVLLGHVSSYLLPSALSTKDCITSPKCHRLASKPLRDMSGPNHNTEECWEWMWTPVLGRKGGDREGSDGADTLGRVKGSPGTPRGNGPKSE